MEKSQASEPNDANIPESNEEIDINIKTQSDENFPLKVLKSIQVAELKAIVKDTTTVPEGRQRLIYRGRVLQDGSPLNSYNIENGHTVHLVARPQESAQPSGTTRNRTTTQREQDVERSGALGRRLVMGTLALPSIGMGLGVPSLADLLNGQASPVPAGAIPSTRSIRGGSSEGSNGTTVSGVDENSLEHVRQGLLTMHTLLSTRDEEEEKEEFEQQSEGKEEYSSHIRRSRAGAQRRHFFVGQWLDVKDTVNQWLEATVMEIRSNGDLLVHYNGWPSRWDEFMPPASPRICPFRTRTLHSGNAPTISPCPVTVVRDAPPTGDDDLRLLVPEVNQMLQRLQPMMSVLVKLCEEHTELADTEAATGETTSQEASSNTRQRMPWVPRRVRFRSYDLADAEEVKKSRDDQWDVGRSRRSRAVDDLPDSDDDVDQKMREDILYGDAEEEKKSDESARKEKSELKRELVPFSRGLLEAGLEIAPLLDRMGRILADLAPHLANLKRMRPEEQTGEDETEALLSNAGVAMTGTSGLRPHRTNNLLNSVLGDGPATRSSGSGARARGTTSSRPSRPRSPSPETAFRQLIQTPTRTGAYQAPSAGNIDIHIHAIVPLQRPSNPVGGSANNIGSAPNTGSGAPVLPSDLASGATSARNEDADLGHETLMSFLQDFAPATAERLMPSGRPGAHTTGNPLPPRSPQPAPSQPAQTSSQDMEIETVNEAMAESDQNGNRTVRSSSRSRSAAQGTQDSDSTGLFGAFRRILGHRDH